MDTIAINDLQMQTRIGIPDAERRTPQTLLVSIEMETDTHAAGASDDVGESIDYDQVANAVRELATTERKTVERFAEDVATMILERFGPAKVTVSVKKFALPKSDHIAVTISRP